MRKSTPLDAVAEAHVEALAVNDPLEATGIGLPGHDHELPDLDAIIAHVTQSVGTPEFGKPRLPPGHDEIRFTPQESLELLWQPFVASLLQALEVPAADWPLACGLAIQELMAQGKDVLAPHLAATIVMECAIPMSKILNT